ncbi:MAG: M28 family peptidase [Adhaeribacter sp.]
MKTTCYPYFALLALALGCSPKTVPSAAKAEAPASTEALLAAAPAFAATITGADLSRHLHILASDEYEGRDTGAKGQKMAAAYIAREFQQDGLTGPVTNSPTSPYYQTFNLEKTAWGEGYILVGTKKFRMQEDFYVVGGGSPYQTEEQAEVVFAGYGIDDSRYSDYANLNVAGKMVVVLAGEPKDSKGNYLVSGTPKASDWGNDYRTKRSAALKKGAKSVLIVTGTSAGDFRTLTQRYESHGNKPTISMKAREVQAQGASLLVSPALGAALLGTTPEKMLAHAGRVSQAGKAVAGNFPGARNVRIKTLRQTSPLPTENVLGFIEGSDKKEEVIVITAHYDHVGVDSSLVGDQIFNGANDDGSGTVAVIEMAQAFAQAKKEGKGPRRSILFMTVSGEEKGLLGSEYYSANPVFPLANTVANINIDMIGRMDFTYEKTNDSNYIYVIGSDKLSSELHQINEAANTQHVQLKLDYTYNDENDPNRFYYRSDHYNFAKHGIPSIFYFNGVHADYHKPGDEVSKILFKSAEKVARLAFHTAWQLANREDRIKVDSNKK